MQLFSQKNCNITKEYSTIFRIEKRVAGERVGLLRFVNTLDESNCYYNMVNSNKGYLDYLHTYASKITIYNDLIALDDSAEIADMYFDFLEKDSLFNHVMKDLDNKYKDSSTFIHDTVSMDQLLNIAVKFFYVSKYEDGELKSYFCGGTNALRKTEKSRKPHLEAFCFSSIYANYSNEQYNMRLEFDQAIEEALTLNLGLDNNERLLRLQGAVFILMRNNKILKSLLLEEYTKKKNFLPFVLIDN